MNYEGFELPFTMPEALAGFDPSDFATADGARKNLETLQKVARDTFEHVGRFDMAAFIWGTYTGGGPPAICMTAAEDMDWRSKDVFAGFVAHLCKTMRAVAVAHVSEIWAVANADRAATDAWVDKHGTLADYPGRREQLMINFECVRFCEVRFADITESADPLNPAETRRKLGAWVAMSRDTRFEGRFVGLLMPVKERPS